MRRQLALSLAALATMAIAGCQSNAAAPGPVVIDSLVTDSTAVIPGSCDPAAEALPPPTITIDGTDTVATFGVGAYECGAITGDGYVVYSFNPVLLDADSPIRVTINSKATATVMWSLGDPFTDNGDNVWTSAAPTQGCARLTVELTSPSGINTATYGADIRVGGNAIDCPQRVIDPTDPGDIGSVPVNTPAGSGPPPPITATPTPSTASGPTTTTS